VELKKTCWARRKANHSSYLAIVIGEGVNSAPHHHLNYDGKKKHVTTIETRVHRSDTQLVAPGPSTRRLTWAPHDRARRLPPVPGVSAGKQRNIEGCGEEGKK